MSSSEPEDVIDVPYHPSLIFEEGSRTVLHDLADPMRAEPLAPWGLYLEIEGHEHYFKSRRHVFIQPSTRVHGVGFVPGYNKDGIIQIKTMPRDWRRVAADVYLTLVGDGDVGDFLRRVQRRFPQMIPDDIRPQDRNIGMMIVDGGALVMWDPGIPRWDEGIKEVRQALSQNVHLFVEASDSAHRRMEALGRLQKLLSAQLGRSADDGYPDVPPLARLRLVLDDSLAL